MKALLFQLDGKLPNIALMRIGAHHRALGHEVELRRGKPEPQLWDEEPDFVYGSAIFQSTRPAAERLRLNYPQAVIGGTGWDLPPLLVSSLESIGIGTLRQDYSLYPNSANQ